MNPLERQTTQLQEIHSQEKVQTINKIVNAINKAQWQKAFQAFQQYHQQFAKSQQQAQLSDREKFQIWEIYYHEALTYFNSGKHKRGQVILQKLLKIISNNQIRTSNRSSRASTTTINLCQHSQIPIQYDTAKYQPQLYLRILTSLICFKLKLHNEENKQSTAKQLYDSTMKYLQMIKQNFNQRLQAAPTYEERQQILTFRKQIIGRLTGCYSLFHMKNIKSNHIEQTKVTKGSLIGAQKKEQETVAEMFRIAADWKYVVGQNQEAILFKQKALKYTESLKKLKQSKQIAYQLLAIKNEDHKSHYLLKLAIIKKIIQNLQQIQGNEKNYSVRATIAKIGYFSQLMRLKQRQSTDLQNAKRNSNSLSLSQLRQKQSKQEKINDMINSAVVFYQTEFELAKNSVQTSLPLYKIVCPLLYRSKFITKRQLIVQKYFSAFNRIISKRKRQAIDKIKAKSQKNKTSVIKSRLK